jgi:drug/metabolite transporter (DMT)-like permease
LIDRKSHNEGIWLLAALALLWGANWPAMKLAVGEIGPWTFRTICLYVGAGGLFAVALVRRIPLGLPRGRIAVFAATSFLNVTVWHVTSAYGLTLLAAGRAVLVAFTMPLWAALFGALFFGDKFTPRKVVALSLGLVGLGFLALPASDTLGSSPAGLGLMLAAAVGWGAGTVWLKASRFEMSAVTLTAWQLALGGVPVIVGMLALEVAGIGGGTVLKNDAPSLAGLVGLIYAATVPMVFCHWAWFRALEILPASLASIGTLAVPVVGVLASALLLGETVGWSEMAALVCVVAALALALLQF